MIFFRKNIKGTNKITKGRAFNIIVKAISIPFILITFFNSKNSYLFKIIKTKFYYNK